MQNVKRARAEGRGAIYRIMIQGISDAISAACMRRRGRSTWRKIEGNLGKAPSCLKLKCWRSVPSWRATASPVRSMPGDASVKIFLFVATLGYRRRLHLRTFRDERQGSWFAGFDGAPFGILVGFQKKLCSRTIAAWSAATIASRARLK